MSDFYNVIESDNFNDLYRMFHRAVLDRGVRSKPRGMGIRELMNCSLILTNPRNRILESQVRKHNYSYGVGEFFWYLRGTNSLSEIMFYLKRMKDFSDDNKTLNSAYGERMFGYHHDFPNQWQNIVETLVADPDSRQAVLTIYQPTDITKRSKDVPCTLNMQFLIRENKLNMILRMRSNDSYMGLIYDVYSFTMFQEMMLNELNFIFKEPIEMGSYVHNAGSLHLYDRDEEGARRVCDEVQSFQVEPQREIHNIAIHDLRIKEILLREMDIPIPEGKFKDTYQWMAMKLNKQLERNK